jgi:multiple sugar transport system ATP-binding protein
VASAPGDRRAAAFSVENLDLTIHDGETMVILGPSGCGKTTLLKIIAGLIAPDSGQVRYDGVSVTEMPPGEGASTWSSRTTRSIRTSTRRRMSCRISGSGSGPPSSMRWLAKYQRTRELMGVELAYLLDRKPTTLSGGEKQRVALGRCITRDPALFLLDEPFSNLDRALREKYRVNLKILLKQFDITTVYVTHDHSEALILAGRLAVMDGGRIKQVGTYQEIYDPPGPDANMVHGWPYMMSGSSWSSLVEDQGWPTPGGSGRDCPVQRENSLKVQ